MSELFEEELDELQDDLQDDLDQVGQTSEELTESTEADDSRARRRAQAQDAVRKFTVFDAMLLISLLCISLATFLMFLELTKFGSFPGFVWRTNEAVVEAVQ